MSWVSRVIWAECIEYDRAVEVLTGRQPMEDWDEFAWRCWVETGWDQRPPAELDEQPPIDEVPCYEVADGDLEAMGVVPAEPGKHVVFLCHPLKCAIACSSSRLYVPEDDV